VDPGATGQPQADRLHRSSAAVVPFAAVGPNHHLMGVADVAGFTGADVRLNDATRVVHQNESIYLPIGSEPVLSIWARSTWRSSRCGQEAIWGKTTSSDSEMPYNRA